MKEQSIFLAALEIQDPAARLVYLKTACAGDAVLRGQVETHVAAIRRSAQQRPEIEWRYFFGIRARLAVPPTLLLQDFDNHNSRVQDLDRV